MVITLGQEYNVGEKPTVILYTYINRHAGTPTKAKFVVVCHSWCFGYQPEKLLYTVANSAL